MAKKVVYLVVLPVVLVVLIATVVFGDTLKPEQMDKLQNPCTSLDGGGKAIELNRLDASKLTIKGISLELLGNTNALSRANYLANSARTDRRD